jgi:hypothetical protein
MNIYKISQTEQEGYDTYDSAIVVANDPEEAAKIYPGGGELYRWTTDWVGTGESEKVKVEYLGMYDGDLSAGSVILASYNAG